MNFSEHPPSDQWATLRYKGQNFAEVWFKPEGKPFALTFRIRQSSFQIPGMARGLTTESLLKAVGIAAAEVESWHLDGAVDGSNPELGHPLPPPPQDVAHLDVFVNLKPPAEVVAADDSRGLEISEAMWQDLEARWKAILNVEAGIDTLRISMGSLRAEMEGASKRMMSPEEKAHSLNADVAQWNKAKGRLLFVIPKAKEFIHRSTWAMSTPERKELEDVVNNHIRPRLPFPHLDKVVKDLDALLKDRQVLAAHGNSIFQECKNVSTEVQNALRTLQSNASANATKKRAASKSRGKS